ncbi:hypothetical protein AOLI_G00098100 [Acnodon oligacanthus]
MRSSCCVLVPPLVPPSSVLIPIRLDPGAPPVPSHLGPNCGLSRHAVNIMNQIWYVREREALWTQDDLRLVQI